jgi:hypothetical protein
MQCSTLLCPSSGVTYRLLRPLPTSVGLYEAAMHSTPGAVDSSLSPQRLVVKVRAVLVAPPSRLDALLGL